LNAGWEQTWATSLRSSRSACRVIMEIHDRHIVILPGGIGYVSVWKIAKAKGARVSETDNVVETPSKPSLLHVCTHDVMRPIRDQILRLAGYNVDSADNHEAALQKIRQRRYDLALIDIHGQHQVRDAEQLCEEIKTNDPDQRIAFACNWRVAILTDCPDEVVRSEFDPVAFVSGVKAAVAGNYPN
jgi:CheY-like chemotaxis protein